jgi:iron(III) transport system permease protein
MTAVETPPVGAEPPPDGKRRFRITGRRLYIAGTVALLLYLVAGPLGILIFSSFKRTEGALPFEAIAPYSLENYRDVFLSASTYDVVWNTAVYAAGALFVSFAIAIALAWLVERTDIPMRNTIYTLVIAALGIPAVIAGISWGLLGNPRIGVVNVFIRFLLGTDELGAEGPFNVFSFWGMIFVQAITMVPVTFLLITGAFRAMDASLEEAAVVSGASFKQTVRRVSLPILAPALFSALIYQLVTVVESFDIPLVIGLRSGISVLSTRVFIEVVPVGGLPNYGLASTFSVLMLLVALGPLLYYNRIIARADRFSTVSGKDFRQKRYELGRAKPFALFGVFLYVLVALILPLLILIWTSLIPFYEVPSMSAMERVSLDAFRNLNDSAFFTDALRNTVVVGLAVAVGAMLIGVLTAWIVVRTRTKWARALDVLAYLPHAMPGVIIGTSVLLIYLRLREWVPVSGTIWIIVIALSTQYTSLSTRLMNGAISQIQVQLEEAAEVSGANQTQIFRKILLPLIMPPFINGALLIFLLSIRNLTLALILQAPQSILLSVLIFFRWDAGQTEDTAAIGIVMLVITLAMSVALRRASAFGDAAR